MTVHQVKTSIAASIFFLSWFAYPAMAGSDEIEITGSMERGSPCLLIRASSGKVYSLKGVHRSKIELGKNYLVKGKKLKTSNCQQGATVQISEIKVLD